MYPDFSQVPNYPYYFATPWDNHDYLLDHDFQAVFWSMEGPAVAIQLKLMSDSSPSIYL